MHHSQLRTVAAIPAFHASRRPTATALVCQGRALDYAALHRESNRAGHALRAAGLRPGARVAYLGRESEHYYEILFGCAKSGTVLVPVNWRLTAAEVRHILADSGTELLFVEREFHDSVARIRDELPDLRHLVVTDRDGEPGAGYRAWAATGSDDELDAGTGPDDPIAQIYTSGTTGLPKGVVLAQRSFFAVRDLLAAHGLDWIDWRAGDVSLVAVPGFHIGGLWWALQGLSAGVTNVVMRMFADGDAVDLIREHRVTTTCMVPAMLQMVLAEPRVGPADFASLRKVVYGGSPISESLLGSCLATMRCEFAQIYGLTETGKHRGLPAAGRARRGRVPPTGGRSAVPGGRGADRRPRRR
ncbi:long-chain acyl-CoA synthetase [Micromonospora pattaloongensis]|uniref:Long-chain acyl-CoA synthetase n=1 Tax=Micromonospora pattaloongensis TaxID=405436 RepID=A0A1H3PAS5_9ACTN|nr:AMP-binding protein [Micromonospora pattaloongensis]SDY98244.1 long-chain acyl-CoA synthetase [Micromonospora pattaloongensis]